MASIPDYDPQETQEWLDALESVLENEGAERVRFLLGQLLDRARHSGAGMPFSATTPYCNTIPVGEEIRSTGNQDLEHRIRGLMRWNAMALVLNANRDSSELGGHIASFASAATLYDVGFNHFFHGKTDTHGGDLVYFQGHSSPGMYARAFLEGRISEEQMYKFRQEAEGGGGTAPLIWDSCFAPRSSPECACPSSLRTRSRRMNASPSTARSCLFAERKTGRPR